MYIVVVSCANSLALIFHILVTINSSSECPAVVISHGIW